MRIITLILVLSLSSIALGTPVPSAPTPHPVERDPVAWGVTTGFTSSLTGTFVHPWIGFAAGVAVAVFPNMQDSRNAHQNMVGGMIGAGAGYVLIKTLRKDWHHPKGR